MTNTETLIEQVRSILIQSEDTKPKHEIYGQFINECKSNNLTEDDFYKKILKVAHKSIDWNFIEEEKKKKEREKIEKEKKEKEIEKELEEVKKQIKYAPHFIDRLIKTAFESDVVTKEELARIFDKAERLSQDTYELAEKIDALLNEKKYKSYPKADFDLPSLRQTICSTDWHSEERFQKLTTPPPEPFPWKVVVTASLLILFAISSLTYLFYLKPKWRDDAAPRYYTLAQDATLRSSQVAGVDYNKLATLNYGTELITYEVGSEWCNVKADGKIGFVSTKLVLDSANFYLLNSIFGDAESKDAIEFARWRKALLDYYKKNNYIGKLDESLQKQIYGGVQSSKEIWQTFSKGKDVKPNSFIYTKVVNPHSKFADFGVIIKNITTGKRKFLLFTFSDDETSHFVFEQPAPDDGDIKAVKALYQNGQPGYSVFYTDGSNSVSLVANKTVPSESQVSSSSKLLTTADFYIINVYTTQRQAEAELETKEFQKQGYPAGYLWIPSYPSLGGGKSFCVYIGPFSTQQECEVATEKFKKIDPDAYGLLVSQKNRKVIINGVGKITSS